MKHEIMIRYILYIYYIMLYLKDTVSYYCYVLYINYTILYFIDTISYLIINYGTSYILTKTN